MNMLISELQMLASDWRSWIVVALMGALVLQSVVVFFLCPYVHGKATITVKGIGFSRSPFLKCAVVEPDPRGELGPKNGFEGGPNFEYFKRADSATYDASHYPNLGMHLPRDGMSFSYDTVTSNVSVEFDSPSGAVNVGCEAPVSLSVTDVPPVWVQE